MLNVGLIVVSLFQRAARPGGATWHGSGGGGGGSFGRHLGGGGSSSSDTISSLNLLTLNIGTLRRAIVMQPRSWSAFSRSMLYVYCVHIQTTTAYCDIVSDFCILCFTYKSTSILI